MRKTILLLASMALAVLLGSGVALAAALSSQPDAGTAQTNGQVRAILGVGDKIYIGGTFTSVAGEPRSRLAAIDASTGRLTGWAPKAQTARYSPSRLPRMAPASTPEGTSPPSVASTARTWSP